MRLLRHHLGVGDFVPTLAMYQFPQNSVLEYEAAGGISYGGGLTGLGGLGTSMFCPVAVPGTDCDPNCPSWCAFVPLSSDMSLSCWPCSNVCPTGQQWDTTNLKCSATPTTTGDSGTFSSSTGVPAAVPTAPQGCPGYCDGGFIASFLSQCNACTPAGGVAPGSMSWVVAVGLGIAGLVLFMALRK